MYNLSHPDQNDRKEGCSQTHGKAMLRKWTKGFRKATERYSQHHETKLYAEEWSVVLH